VYDSKSRVLETLVNGHKAGLRRYSVRGFDHRIVAVVLALN